MMRIDWIIDAITHLEIGVSDKRSYLDNEYVSAPFFRDFLRGYPKRYHIRIKQSSRPKIISLWMNCEVPKPIAVAIDDFQFDWIGTDSAGLNTRFTHNYGTSVWNTRSIRLLNRPVDHSSTLNYQIVGGFHNITHYQLSSIDPDIPWEIFNAVNNENGSAQFLINGASLPFVVDNPLADHVGWEHMTVSLTRHFPNIDFLFKRDGKLHRTNGPAKISMEKYSDVHVFTSGKKRFQSNHYGTWWTEWFVGGQRIAWIKIKEYAHRNNILLRDSTCLRESIFMNPEDELALVADLFV